MSREQIRGDKGTAYLLQQFWGDTYRVPLSFFILPYRVRLSFRSIAESSSRAAFGIAVALPTSRYSTKTYRDEFAPVGKIS